MDVQTIIKKAGSVGKLARKLGVSHSTICDWNRAGAIPGNRVSQISEQLGVKASDVLTLVRAPAAARRPSLAKKQSEKAHAARA